MDLPIPHACSHDETFWSAARENRLMLQRCKTTGCFQWYPRGHSLFAAHSPLEWIESPGLGTLWTFSVVHRSYYPALPAPYVFAIVRLNEGVQLTGHLVDVPIIEIKIGLVVQAFWTATSNAPPLLVFKPVGAPQ